VPCRSKQRRPARTAFGKHAADASDRIIYNKDTGALYYHPNGTSGAPRVELRRLCAASLGPRRRSESR